MTKDGDKELGHSQSLIRKAVREHGLIILYVLQFLLVLMYMEAEIQPFVYVHF